MFYRIFFNFSVLGEGPHDIICIKAGLGVFRVWYTLWDWQQKKGIENSLCRIALKAHYLFKTKIECVLKEQYIICLRKQKTYCHSKFWYGGGDGSGGRGRLRGHLLAGYLFVFIFYFFSGIHSCYKKISGASLNALKYITHTGTSSWHGNSFLSNIKKEKNCSKDINILSAKTKIAIGLVLFCVYLLSNLKIQNFFFFLKLFLLFLLLQ